MTDAERIRIGLPPSTPLGVISHPLHVEFLREVQLQCLSAMRLHPENADWHLRGLLDYFGEEIEILYPPATKKD